MGRHLSTAIATLVLIAAPLGAILFAEYPVPSKYPVAWELGFVCKVPQRIVVPVLEGPPVAFWYMTYKVTNTTGTEQTFLPFFELVTSDGQVLRSDKGIPLRAFEAIRDRERNPLLEAPESVGGTLRLGAEQARESVAIWAEPSTEMGSFTVFVGGLSGEKTTVTVNDSQSILRKTLELNFLVRGDDVKPEEDRVVVGERRWVMR